MLYINSVHDQNGTERPRSKLCFRLESDSSQSHVQWYSRDEEARKTVSLIIEFSKIPRFCPDKGFCCETCSHYWIGQLGKSLMDVENYFGLCWPLSNP